MPASYDMRVGGLGGISTLGVVAQLAAQPRVALAPGLEAPGDRVEQPSFGRRWFLNGRSAEKIAPSSAYQRMLCLPRI